MDYYQTTNRYRKREAISRLRFIISVAAVVLSFWFGWFLGHQQQWSVFFPSNERLSKLTQDNNRLEQTLAVLSQQLNSERQKRITAEALIDNEDKDVIALRKLVSGYLAKDIPPERITQLLNSLGAPSKCRKLQGRDVEVVTPHLAIGDSNRKFLSDSLTLFIEGTSRIDTDRQNPWFDPSQPVRVRAAFLGGEKNAEGVLPLTMTLAMEDWMIRIRLTATELKGYANVTISKCLIE